MSFMRKSEDVANNNNLVRLMGGALYYLLARFLPNSSFPFLGSYFNAIRRFCCRLIFSSIDNNVKIDRKAYFGINNNISIDYCSGLGENFHLQGADVVIGKYVMMAPNVTILGNGHKFDSIEKPMMEQGATPRGKLVVEDDVWIGRNVTILPGCNRIGCGVVIGACSVVTKNIPAFEVWVGNPAHCIRKRN